jgi:ElaB/YqjD/DUF883 family membrane-anchored ribosome-binding protein
MNPSNFNLQDGKLVDHLSASADQAMQSVERAAHGALNGISHSAQDLRQKARDLSAGATGYIQHEPVKAVLIAAATGAALMALLSLARRSGN